MRTYERQLLLKRHFGYPLFSNKRKSFNERDRLRAKMSNISGSHATSVSDSLAMASALLEIRSDSAPRSNDTTAGQHLSSPSQGVRLNNPQAEGTYLRMASPVISGMNAFQTQSLASLQDITAGSTIPPGYPPHLLSLFARPGPAPAVVPFSTSPPSRFVTAPATPVVHQAIGGTVVGQGNSGDTSAAAAGPIRKEKIDAALKSKPQRGKKRENLSDLERIELTRTRNREHAKSTRIRKKQRYNELVECEEQLRELQKGQELTEERRRTVLNFLALRERNIRGASRTSDESAESDKTSTAGNRRKGTDELADLIAGTARFTFEESSASAQAATRQNDPAASLDRADKMVAKRIEDVLGASVVPLISLTVEGSNGSSIAFNSNNTAFAEVVLSAPSREHRSYSLMTAFVRFRFEDGAPKLQSVRWSIVEDSIKKASLECLQSQSSYPSVVSLEVGPDKSAPTQAGDGTKTTPTRADNGPGMDI